MKLLCDYSWPGNIRELENAIEQAVVLSNQPVLAPDDLPAAVRDSATSRLMHNLPPNGQFIFSDIPTLEEVKKRYVLHVLRRNQENVSRTARVLNIDRRSLYRMLARYKIEPFFKR
jgi:DNA-binding NtrC family response regulator